MKTANLLLDGSEKTAMFFTITARLLDSAPLLTKRSRCCVVSHLLSWITPVYGRLFGTYALADPVNTSPEHQLMKALLSQVNRELPPPLHVWRWEMLQSSIKKKKSKAANLFEESLKSQRSVFFQICRNFVSRNLLLEHHKSCRVTFQICVPPVLRRTCRPCRPYYPGLMEIHPCWYLSVTEVSSRGRNWKALKTESASSAVTFYYWRLS